MKKEKLISLTKRVLLLLLLTSVLLVCAACGGAKYTIAIEGELAEGDTIEYTGGKIQFPVAYVADQRGKIVSYNVLYKVINLADQSECTDEYAAFDLKPGAYQITYTYGEDDGVSKTVSFDVVDTTAPAIAFLEIPNGLFLQDITEDSVNKLPLYSMEDASSGEGIELTQTLKFKGAGNDDFQEHPFRKINNSYEIESFGTFVYELTATDCYGNTTTAACQWKVKDRTWKPEKALPEGILADYSEEGYCNLVEGGDVNQYYKIDNDYADTFLPEFEGAKGVMKIEMGFNNAAGYGNNTIRLRVPKTFTKEDLEGKYLAVRIYVEGEHLKNTFLFGGNNVAFRDADATTRAFTADMTGLKTGEWMTFYLEAAAVENIGMYPNATYNPETTFYEGGDPGDSVQLCFHREAGYFNDMTLYIDSISLAEILPDTTLTIDGDQASWTAVEGAVGYRIELNGEETVSTKTSISLPGKKGYIRVTPMGDGVLTLDAQTVTGVYGLDPGDSVAAFDDPLYAELFNDRLRFSTDAEHNGYRPKFYTGTMTDEGLRMDIGTGAWGVVSGIRFQFPQAQEKGDNTTLILNMKVADSQYGQIRVYDYAGKQLGVIKLDESNTGDFHEFEIDISAYTGKMEGIQLIFGPNSGFTSVNSGVSITFKDISLKNTYYPIWVDGQYLMCAGTRKLTPGYTNKDVVQFTTFFNFNVGYDDTPLNFSGTVRLDGKKVQRSALKVVGYPNTDTICFKLPHSGKILTIMEGSVIYYDGIAVEVEETFNARWNGSSWEYIAQIPPEPAPEYVTLADGSVKKVENKMALEPGHTANGVVQFLNVYDFGVGANDTPLGFEGTVMIDGEVVRDPRFVGYPSNLTIALKEPHQGKLLTIMQGSVIYYGDTAVVVSETFNAIWNGSYWSAVSAVPPIPETQYVTLADGITREVVANVNLTPGYTMDNLIQFPDIYDFGAPADSTPIGFEGTVLLQGREVEDPTVTGYKDSKTIGLENLSHKGKVVTIKEGAIFYNDTAAVKVKSTFNAMWDGTSWTYVDDIPEPEPPHEGPLTFQYRGGAANKIQVNTNVLATTPIKNFTAGENGCNIDQSANPYQQVGWIEMTDEDGTIVLTFHFNGAFEAGQYYILPAGAVFGFTDGSKYTLDDTYVFVWDGISWTLTNSVPGPSKLNFAYRYGTNNLIQINTNLPVTTPLSNFLAGDNGCNLGQSGDQQVGWVGMDNVDGTIVLTFHFNNAFEAGQYYALDGESVFGFTDGKTYPLDKDYVFVWDGSSWTVSDTAPESTKLNFAYRYGTNNLIQVNTNLPASTPLVNFDADDNGCSIDQSANLYQQMGWVGMDKVDDTIVLTFHFNSNFTIGQDYILPAGSVFGFTDGKTYELDKDYVFTWDGSSWTLSNTLPTFPALSLQYYTGANNLIGVATNLPTTTPTGNYFDYANGSKISQSGDQQMYGFAVVTEQGQMGLAFSFSNGFEVGQHYVLAKDSVFGFADGNRYKLDKDYVFTWNGTKWVTSDTVPDPAPTELSFAYRYGTNNLIQIDTNLPSYTHCDNFLSGDNGCNIIQSGNQNVGWVGMDNVDGTIVLTFHFNNAFEAGQYYALAKDSVFGFPDGKTYPLDKAYVFVWDGSTWTVSDTAPAPTELSLQYYAGTDKLIGVAANLPSTTPLGNYAVDANGSNIDQSANIYQQMNGFAVITEQGQMGLAFSFSNGFKVGQHFVLGKDSVFVFEGGKTYTLDKTYVFTWNGSSWVTGNTIPEPTVGFAYRYGANNLIQVNTNLPSTTPIANFGAGDNGCVIDQSSNQYQQVGWIGMDNADGTIVLTFNFNAAFSAGQNYILPAGSVFGFTDNRTYTLDKDYVFTWDGSNWTVSNTIPDPAPAVLNLQYYNGTNKIIGLATDLPNTTPLKNFLATDNGCNIDQSANLYQQVGSIEMVNQGGIIGLLFHFNSEFKVGQNYILPAGAVFGFTDGKTYTLDKTYVFTWNGSSWDVSDTVPEPTVGFAYRYGANNLIQVNTNLPASTPLADFTADKDGFSITQSGDQSVGWVQMLDAEGTVVLTFHFNGAFEAGQYYALAKDSVFTFGDRAYKLDKDYVFIYDGSNWSVSDTVPELTVGFAYRYGANNLIQVNTNLPASTPLADFTTDKDGFSITQSGDQSVGWVQMLDAEGTVVLTFHFNGAFEAGQYYALAKDSVFTFGDKAYKLDKTYVFIWNGSSWDVSDTAPAPEPEKPKINFAYRYGANNLIQVNTNLPASTTLADFTADKEGFSITQSGDQVVGWVQMLDAEGTIVLTFHFNGAFEAGQSYTLAKGSVFGFTDGSYVLDANYTFTWDGSNWAMVASE